MTRRICFFILLAIPVLLIQGIKINRPFVGHFASYQLVMASMSRNMVRENFTQLLLPKTDLLVNGQRSLHLNQYPFPSLAAAIGIKFFDGSMEFWGRFQAILCNLISILLMGLIANRLWNEEHAWVAMVIYAFSPFTLIYGQGYFSEAMALLFLLLGLFFLLRSEKISQTLLSAFCFSLAVTSRIHWVLLLPVFLSWIVFCQKEKRLPRSVIFCFAAMVIPALWYGYTYWMGLRTDHLLTNAFLQAGMREWGDHKYLLDPEYYKRVLDIFSGTMLTPLLFPFFFLGMFAQPIKRTLFLLGGIFVGSLIIVLSPQKIMAHDFYLYGIFPFVCWLTTCGIVRTFDGFPVLSRGPVRILLLMLALSISIRYAYHPIFKYHENINSLRSAALAVEANTRSDDTIIVASMEPAELVYYANRPAVTLDLANIGRPLPGYLTNSNFTIVDKESVDLQEAAMKDPITWLEYLHANGARFVVTSTKREIQKSPLLKYLEKNYKKLSRLTDDFYLFALTS